MHEKGLRLVPVHVWGQLLFPNCLKHQESFYSNRAEVGEMPNPMISKWGKPVLLTNSSLPHPAATRSRCMMFSQCAAGRVFQSPVRRVKKESPERCLEKPIKNTGRFVPPTMKMREFTLRAVLLGLVMTVVLGAANAYLGLRAV